MAKERKAYAPFSLTSEAGVAQTPVEGYIDVRQEIYPTVSTGTINENDKWTGVKSSDSEFLGLSKAEAIPSGTDVLFPDTNTHPNTVWGSSTSDFDTYSPTDRDATVNADNSLTFTLSTDQVNQITGMYGGRYLHLFTKDGTFNLSSGSATQGLTATTVQVVNETKMELLIRELYQLLNQLYI